MKSLRYLLLVAMLVMACVGVPVGADLTGLKVISSKTLITKEEIAIAETDFVKNNYIVDSGKTPSATLKKNHVNKISVTVDATPRSSGGITAELFCPDNTGRFVAVWGGSVTAVSKSWEFTETEIMRKSIDGCYIAVVDSTAEMEAMR